MSEDPLETCPVCGTSIPEGEEECPECGAILDLFDIDVEGEVEEESMEKIMDMILDEGEEKEVIEDIKELGLPEDEIPLEEESEAKPEGVEEIITFECPVCGSEVADEAVECPECGAIFEESTEEIAEEEIGGIGEIESGLGEESEILEEELVDFEDEIESFQDDIESFADSEIDIEYMRDDLEKLRKAHEEDEEKKGEELVEKISENITHLNDIEEKVKGCERYLEALSDKIDVSGMKENVEEIYEGTEIGEYQAAAKKAEEVKDEIKERTHEEGEGWLKSVIEDKVQAVEKNLEETAPRLDLDHIKEELDRAESAKRENKIDEGFHRSVKALKASENALQVTEKIEEAEGYEKKLKERGVDVEEFTAQIDETLDKMGEIENQKILDELDETIEEMNEKLEREKEIEKISKERKRKDLFKKIQLKIPKMKSLLKTAKDFDLDTEDGRSLINKAVEHTKENDYKKGVNKLKECEESIQQKLDNEIENKIKKFEEAEIAETELPVEEVKRFKEKGNYERAVELIEEAEENLEFKKKPEEELEGDISKLEKILSHAEDLEFETGEAENLLEKARTKKEGENWSSSRDLIEECEDSLENELLDFLKNEIQIAKEELKEAKDKGKDVSEPIDLLKQANRLQKEKNLEGSFESVKKYKEKMSEMREEL